MHEDGKRVSTAPTLWGINHRAVSDLAKITAVALVYFVSGKLGLKFAFLNQSATAVWPPTGIALAAVLLLGYRVWPGIWLGAFLVNITTAGSLLTTICIAGGNTLEIVLGAWLVRRFANGWRAVERARDIILFALLAAALSSMVSATVGVTSLALGGFAPWNDYAAIWTTWWFGDAVSALVLTPLLLIWITTPLPRWERRQYSEAALALTLVSGISLLGFSGPRADPASQYPRFLMYPASLWAAYRFRRRGAACALFVVSSVAIWGTLHGLGPFASADPNKSLLLLQVWMSAYAMTMLVLGTVVTERERAEKDALTEKHLSDAIVNSLPGIFYMIDETSQSFVRWNWNLEKVSGYSSDEIARMNPLEFFEGPDKELIRARIQEVFAKGQSDAEAHLVSKEGKKTPYYFVGRRFTTATTKYLTGLGVDVTERKRAEEAQARLAAIVESSDDAILGKDLSGIITSWNAAAAKLYGYTAEEAIGKSVSLLIPPGHPDEEPRILAKLRRGQSIHRHEAVHTAKDGRRIDVSLTISPIKDSDGRVIGASRITRDITERKQTEAELENWRHHLESRVEERTIELVLAHKQLQSQIEERKRLEAEMARAIEREQLRLGQELHDGLGQQLAGIGYMISALQTKLESQSAPAARDAEKVEKLVLESVEQVRHLAKGFYPVELERYGLLFALEEMARATERIFGVRCLLQSDESPYVDGKDASAIQFFRIAQEAVHNAGKHAGAKQITIRLAAVNGNNVLSVMDDGIGLPSGAVDESKGMGLRIMQYRARMIGGTLKIGNGPDRGAIVTCAVPTAEWPVSSPPQPQCVNNQA